jgi:hypothetical protein
MTQTMRIDSIKVESNPTTGALDFRFSEGSDIASFALQPMAAINLVNLIMMRLMQRPEEEIRNGLQAFALQAIQAKTMPNGQPYLEYQLENGLRFGSGLELDQFDALHRQLDVILGSQRPKHWPPAQ